MMDERLKIADGTTWPNPKGNRYKDLAWKLRYAQGGLGPGDLYMIAEVMEAYSMLILHPAFTLKKVAQKISGIRKAIKLLKGEG